MTFFEAIALQPDWLQLWILWMSVAMFASPIILLVYRQSRLDGLIVLATSVAVVIFMHVLHSMVGFTRLLGLPHVLLWTPLLIFLIVRIRSAGMVGIPKATAIVLATTIGISLLFDYVDVARYLAGERQSLVPVAPSG